MLQKLIPFSFWTRPDVDPGSQRRGSLEASESWPTQSELRQHAPEPKLQPQVGPHAFPLVKISKVSVHLPQHACWTHTATASSLSASCTSTQRHSPPQPSTLASKLTTSTRSIVSDVWPADWTDPCLPPSLLDWPCAIWPARNAAESRSTARGWRRPRTSTPPF